MQRGRNLADRSYRDVHKRRQVDQVDIDEVQCRWKWRKRCLQHTRLTDPQALLGQPKRRTQASIEQPAGLVAQCPIYLSARRVEQEHIDIAFAGPAQAQVHPRWEAVSAGVARRAEGGDGPVDDRCIRQPAYCVNREPGADLQTFGSRPFSLCRHRQLRVCRRRRRRSFRGWRLGRVIAEESGLLLGICATCQKHACCRDDGDQPLHRSHARNSTVDRFVGPGEYRDAMAPSRAVVLSGVCW